VAAEQELVRRAVDITTEEPLATEVRALLGDTEHAARATTRRERAWARRIASRSLRTAYGSISMR
jgi:hypothetical protein